MFHQVRVGEEDQDALRFLWRENPHDYIDDYKMHVHLFGKNDSPCVVSFVIKQTAKEYDIDHIVAKSIFSVWHSKCKHRFIAWHYYFLKTTLFGAISY